MRDRSIRPSVVLIAALLLFGCLATGYLALAPAEDADLDPHAGGPTPTSSVREPGARSARRPQPARTGDDYRHHDWSEPVALSEAGFELTLTDGAVFRWTDDDWIARVHVTARNVTDEDAPIDRSAFDAEGATAWPTCATFPLSAVVPPGGSVSGTLAWYLSGALPEPRELTVRTASLGRVVPLSSTDLSTPSSAPAEVSMIASVADSWIHTDGDRIVRADVELSNQGTSFIVLAPSSVAALLGETPGSYWHAETTFDGSITLAPGERVRGGIAWYWSGDPGAPPRVTVRLGPAQSSVPVRTS